MIRRIEIVLAGNADKREQGVAAGIGERGAHALGIGGFRYGQTGQSEAIHSPDAWASVVVKLTMPAV